MSVEVTIGQAALGGVAQSILVVPDGSAGAGGGGQRVGQGGVGQGELLTQTLRRTEATARGGAKSLVRTPVGVRVVVMVVELEGLVLQLEKLGG